MSTATIDNDTLAELRGESAPPAPAAPANPDVIAGAARVAANEQAWARAGGFAPVEPYFELGTSLVEVGRENLERSRAEWDRLPPLGEVCANLAGKVRREERTDVVADLPDLMMLGDGQIQVGWKDDPRPIGVEPRGLEGLLRHVPGADHGVGYLVDTCPPDLRAVNANHWFSKATTKVIEKNGAGEELERDKPMRRKLRLRKSGGPVRLWAAVGVRYGRCDADELCEIIEAELPPGARAEATYDGYRMAVTALWHDMTEAESYGVGQFSKAGVRITSADDGTESVDVRAVLYETLCRNLTTVKLERHAAKVRHIGKTVAEKVRACVKLGIASIRPFVEKFAEAEKERLFAEDGDPRETFARLVARGYVKLPGVKPDALVDNLVRAFAFQPGYSKAAAVRAVTRAAHTVSWQSPWARYALEEQAGELVYARVRLAD